MSAAVRGLQISPAVISTSISQFEETLGVRLFQLTARHLMPTKSGISFYRSAMNILESLDLAEAQTTDMTERLTSRLTGLTGCFFRLTRSKQSFLHKICDIEHSLSAAAEYIKRKDMRISGDEIVNDRHECLNLRFLFVFQNTNGSFLQKRAQSDFVLSGIINGRWACFDWLDIDVTWDCFEANL